MLINNTPEQKQSMSKKEVQRARKTAQQLKSASSIGFKTKEVVLSPLYANLMGLVWGFILTLPVLLLYWQKHHYIIGEDSSAFGLLFIISYAIAIPLHEGIHGLCMYLFNGHKKDTIEFGINSGMPYCTCQAPIKKWNYIIVLAMPTIIIGIISSAVAIISGEFQWLLFAFAMFVGAGGDFTVLSKILFRKEKELTIVDHPYKCGCLFLHKEENDVDNTENIIAELEGVQAIKVSTRIDKKMLIFTIILAIISLIFGLWLGWSSIE